MPTLSRHDIQDRKHRLIWEWRTLRETHDALGAWPKQIHWNGRLRSSIGRCTWHRDGTPKCIEIAQWALENEAMTVDQLIDTVRHEAAHALAGPKAGHGWRWRDWARKLGARPEACVSVAGVTTPQMQMNKRTKRWVGVCLHCRREVGRRARKPATHRKFRHTNCPTGGMVFFYHESEVK